MVQIDIWAWGNQKNVKIRINAIWDYNNFKVFQLEDYNDQVWKKYLVKNNHSVMRGSSISQLVHCVSYKNFSGQHCSLGNLDIILHTGHTISFY